MEKGIQQGGFLMKSAYYVHGAIAPIMPFQIPYECKQSIQRTIQDVEGLLDPANMRRRRDKDD